MNFPRYPLKTSTDLDLFEFVSRGKKGDTIKLIQCSKTEITTSMGTIYNLAFGDKKEDGSVDDATISENGDRDKILTTVAIATYEYTARYLDRLIFFRGSNESRTRLYRMAISLNTIELLKDFYIWGITKENEIIEFNSNGDCIGFFGKKKINNFGVMKAELKKAKGAKEKFGEEIIVNKKLDKIAKELLFPEKLKAANKILSNVSFK